VVWLTAVLGLVILLLAGDLLVRGAVNLALRLGIPALLVSLTVVAFGTSAPELLISVQAVLDGVPGLALGNVVGSNTANVLMVLGVPALVARLHTGPYDTRKDYVTMLGVTLFFIGLCFAAPLTWWHGLLLLAVLAGILWSQAREAMAHRQASREAGDEEDVDGADPSLSGWKIAVFMVLGLIGLPLGASLFVDSSVEIAKMFGVSDSVIGLTLVAAGTSLPELATTLVAALRRQADVALGNVIGSNIFNMLAVIGIAGVIAPHALDPDILTMHFPAMTVMTLAVIVMTYNRSRRRGRLSRRSGAMIFASFFIYHGVVAYFAATS
jgi:cation:H+ antiporter